MTSETSGQTTAASGELFGVPFDWTRGDPARLTRVLDACVEHPQWLVTPTDQETIRAVVAATLTNRANLVWEVWRGGEFVGITLLTQHTPQVDALLHFMFLDRNLVGKRRFLLSFLGMCFEDLGLQRVTMEVPESESGDILVSFIRRKLGFRYEGEAKCLALWDAKRRSEAVHAARLGSRRERAHFHKGAWVDVLRLRLLRDEYRGGDECQSQPEPPSSALHSSAG